jgi:hypothetical protein
MRGLRQALLALRNQPGSLAWLARYSQVYGKEVYGTVAAVVSDRQTGASR